MKTKQAISLIVLVITIIVMIVLAGAIILALNNSGIIDKASGAVEETDFANVKELAQMAWAESYLNKSQDTLEDIFVALEDNNVDIDKYGIIATTTGVKVAKGWIQDGQIVAKGRKTLEVGDAIAYDETNGGTITGLKETDWQVLGASDEGELLIMSTNAVDEKTFGGSNSNDLAKAQSDWLNCETVLDEICEPYGKGKGATKARSIRVVDIDRVTGFDKTTYGKGKINEYGNEVTYSYNGTIRPSFTSSNGLSGTILDSGYGWDFNYYNGAEFVVDDLNKSTGIITTIKNDYYSYFYGELGTIEFGSKVHKMLFGEAEVFPDGSEAYDTSYWLASRSVGVSENYNKVNYIIPAVFAGSIYGEDMFDSRGYVMPNHYPADVRAVVALDSNIKLTGLSETGWTY